MLPCWLGPVWQQRRGGWNMGLEPVSTSHQPAASWPLTVTRLEKHPGRGSCVHNTCSRWPIITAITRCDSTAAHLSGDWWPPAPDSPYLNLPGEDCQSSRLINNISALLYSARLLTEWLSRTFPSQHLQLSSDYETELSIPLLACQKEPKNDWRWSEKIMNG